MYRIKATLRSKTDPTLGSVTVQFPIPWQEYDRVLEQLKLLDIGGSVNQDCQEYYSYDGNDRLTRLVDRNGETYVYTYDALNRIVSETNPLDGTKTFHYDKDSRIVGVTDRNGVRTTYKLDGNGNIVESIDGEGHSSFFEYDSMNRLTKVKLRRIDKIHDVDEIQETLYTYDHRGLVKTEVNAAGDGKALVYDGNGNLIQKTDEDGYVTEYEYSPVNLVSKAGYADGKEATYLYDGTGDLIRMVDWVGETTFEYDLLDRLLNVNDHNDRNVNYVYDNVGNTIAIQYPDGTQADYWYDAENQMVELADLDGGLSRFEFDPNGNVIYKEYPNNETAVYSYDAWNQLIELDEYDLGGKKHFKTTYTWDAEGNRLTEMQYNHGQTGKPAALSGDTPNTSGSNGTREMVDALLAAALPNQADLFSLFANNDDPAEGVFALPGMDALSSGNNSSTTPGNGGENTGKDDATIPGNGDGNGQVPPGQTEDDEGGIKNPAGHYPPGLNRGKKPDKPENPDKPGKPENPGTEDKSDRKAQKGEHIYEYNKNGWVTQGTVAKETTTYTYDTLGNLVQEKCKNTVIDYQYNILNQLVSRTDKNDSVTFSYDKRGNRVAETGKKATSAYVYDATNHLVEGTNWQGDKSAYTYNGLFVRVQNTQTTHAGQVYDREFVIDYNSFERNDLMVFSAGYYEQKHIYTAWGERMEQFTERGNWDRLLYVHEDIMGNTRYYTKDNGQSFAELEYDVWGAITSPSKLNNNDNGNFAAANFTGHPYDTVLDIYFAEARFYDANHRQWMSVDPIKSGLNWYEYCCSNPATLFDPNGLEPITSDENNNNENGSKDELDIRDRYNLTQRIMNELLFPNIYHLEEIGEAATAALLASTITPPAGPSFADWLSLGGDWGFIHRTVLKYIEATHANVNTEVYKRGASTYGFVDLQETVVPNTTYNIWELKPESYRNYPKRAIQEAQLYRYQNYYKYNNQTANLGGLGTLTGKPLAGSFMYAAKSYTYAINFYSEGGGKIYYSFYRVNPPQSIPTGVPVPYNAFDPCGDKNRDTSWPKVVDPALLEEIKNFFTLPPQSVFDDGIFGDEDGVIGKNPVTPQIPGMPPVIPWVPAF